MLVLSAVVSIWTLLFIQKERGKDMVIYRKTIYVHKYVPPSFSEKKLRRLIVRFGINCPDIVIAQAKLESNHFKSRLFLQQNNIFGMTYPHKRPTVAIRKDRGFSVYRTWEDALLDYKIFQEYYLKGITSNEKYLNRLSELGYCTSKTYTKTINRLIEKERESP